MIDADQASGMEALEGMIEEQGEEEMITKSVHLAFKPAT